MARSSGSRRTPAAAAPQPPAVTPPRVGEQIQRLRNERKLTLDELLCVRWMVHGDDDTGRYRLATGYVWQEVVDRIEREKRRDGE